MFDSPQQSNPSQVEDILAGVEPAPLRGGTPPPGLPTVATAPARPDVLRPIADMSPVMQQAPLLDDGGGRPKIWLFLGVTLVIVLVFVGGGYLFLTLANKKAAEVAATPTAPAAPSVPTTPAEPPPNPDQPVVPAYGNVPTTPSSTVGATSTVVTAETRTTSTPVVAPPNIPLPTLGTLDSDHDGLTDTEEASAGTDIHNPDTDSDGLSDGDEVHIWKTDPLAKDTDGDGFTDGQEVKNGYNPLGAGKLLLKAKA